MSINKSARPLDGLEKAFWLLDQHRPTHFVMAGDVRGKTTADEWIEALDLTGRQLPQLARRIATVEGQPAFVPTDPHGIPVQVVDGEAGDWKAHAEAELSSRFDTENEPLVRARLLHGRHRSVLLLVFHHTIADGPSAVWLLRDILHRVAGKRVVASDEMRSLEQIVDDGGFEGLDIPDLFTDGTRAPPGFRSPAKDKASVSNAMLDDASTAVLRERARSEGTTVHGALAAAAMRALASLSGADGHPPRVFSPIDARRRVMDGAEHLAVHVNALTVRPDRVADDFWDDARRFGGAVGRFNQTEILATGIRAVREAVMPVSDPVEMAAGWAFVYGAEILLTNLGVVDMPRRYGELALDAVWGPMVSTGIEGEQTLSALGFDDRLHLVHTSFEPAFGFLDGVVRELQQATGE
ncbi:hypothetical protein ABIE56_000307 [Luteibacter sp. 621]|uniref:phthiocerol/phthiodiolone dimycocerosyl transferase family protein n=1 Tax=Luteibacter sp. 621 TaxID=3373916 RepID=UPI003D262AFB